MNILRALTLLSMVFAWSPEMEGVIQFVGNSPGVYTASDPTIFDGVLTQLIAGTSVSLPQARERLTAVLLGVIGTVKAGPALVDLLRERLTEHLIVPLEALTGKRHSEEREEGSRKRMTLRAEPEPAEHRVAVRRRVQSEEDLRRREIEEARLEEIEQQQREAARIDREPKAAAEAAATDESVEKMSTDAQRATMMAVQATLRRVEGDEAAFVAAWIDEIVAEEDFVEDTVVAASMLGEIVTLVKSMPEDDATYDEYFDSAIADSSIDNLTNVLRSLLLKVPGSTVRAPAASPAAATDEVDALAAQLESVLSMPAASAEDDADAVEEADDFEEVVAAPTAADEGVLASELERVLAIE